MLFSSHLLLSSVMSFFFFNDTATTEIYTLSLHDALPILFRVVLACAMCAACVGCATLPKQPAERALYIDLRKARSEEHTLNSSHSSISYAVFCLKKKNKTQKTTITDNNITQPQHKTTSPK